MDADPGRHVPPWRRWRRFVVSDRSMEPTLVAGQGLVAVGTGRARVGQLRVLPHPFRPGSWLVKRVASVADDGRTMRVLSDNTTVDALDSRDLGALPVVGSYRVVVRVPLRLMGRSRGTGSAPR